MIKRALLLPILVAGFPVIALLGHNIQQVPLWTGLRPLVVSVAASGILFVLARLWLRDWLKAGMASALVMILFFSYGHVYELVRQLGSWGHAVGRHRYLLPIWLGIAAGGLWWIRRQPDLASYVAAASVAAAALWCLPTLQIIQAQANAMRAEGMVAEWRPRSCLLNPRPGQAIPDVYLIILDAYARDDMLREIYGFDNTPFLDELRELGFYVAQGSMSNYAHTEMTLASVLNLDYIQSFPGSYDPKTQNRMGLVRLIQDSAVRRELECIGYRTVAFETGYFWTEWEDADIFYTRRATPLEKLQVRGGFTNFEVLLVETSAGLLLTDAAAVLPDFLALRVDDPVVDHRERVLYVLDRLAEVPDLKGPKFVFAHISCPHKPFIFGPEGREGIPSQDIQPGTEAERDAYVDQVVYLNSRVTEVLRSIVAASEVPPIIVVQGDHGMADRVPADKLAVLNAFHLPGGAESRLYPTITTVNTFRLVFAEYFGGDLPLLQDVAYFSPNWDVYRFETIANPWSPRTEG